MAEPGEVLRDRLKAFLMFLKPKLAASGVDQDRLANLRRLSDVRIRRFAVEKPAITGVDLCGLLADPRSGRFDDLADETGLVKKAHLRAVLPDLGEEMGFLLEACVILQVLGPAPLKSHSRTFVERHGASAGATPPAEAAAQKSAPAALSPDVAQLLGPLKDLWTAPSSALKAIALLNSSDASPEAVCAEIERDPSVAVLLLRLNNVSPAVKASSVKRAVVAMGYPLARRLVTMAALLCRLGPPYADPAFDRRAFWLRPIRTAHASALVSRALRLGNPDDHFCAGLLGEVGALAAAKAGAASSGAPAPAAGAAILERWRFPATMVEAARHLRTPPGRIEEFALPREAVVAAAMHALITDKGSVEDQRDWIRMLRIGTDALPSLLESADRAAQSKIDEFLG